MLVEIACAEEEKAPVTTCNNLITGNGQIDEHETNSNDECGDDCIDDSTECA